MRGRPSIPFDQNLVDAICERIATSDDGLEDVLAEISILRGDTPTPSLTVIYCWLRQYPEFQKQMSEARELQSHLLFDRAQKQARDPLIGIVRKVEEGTDKEGRPRDVVTQTTSDNVERSKLLVQTTLRRAGQLNPKKYSEKMQLEHSGPDGGPIEAKIAVEFVRPAKSEK